MGNVKDEVEIPLGLQIKMNPKRCIGKKDEATGKHNVLNIFN